MKIYAIIITVIAVLAVAGAGYFYWQYAGLAGAVEMCQKDKALAENELVFVNEQLAKIAKTVSAFQSVNESFIVPGDLMALTIGSKEAAEVEQKIGEMVDKQDRMSAERDWSDFKTSRRLNALFALFRNFADNLERALNQLK